jgi:hypothetical protein
MPLPARPRLRLRAGACAARWGWSLLWLLAPNWAQAADTRLSNVSRSASLFRLDGSARPHAVRRRHRVQSQPKTPSSFQFAHRPRAQHVARACGFGGGAVAIAAEAALLASRSSGRWRSATVTSRVSSHRRWGSWWRLTVPFIAGAAPLSSAIALCALTPRSCCTTRRPCSQSSARPFECTGL